MLQITKQLITTKTYGFTLRRVSLSVPITQDLYREHIQNMECTSNDEVCFSEVVFELTGGLHAHGIVSVPEKYYLNKFRIRGWKLHLEEIYDKAGWLKYIKKDQPKQYYLKDGIFHDKP